MHPTTTSTTGISILIVEDESIVSMDIADHLEAFGYQVGGQATNGRAACELFTNHAIDLVLMDVHLQGSMDGVETARKILDIRSVPLIYLTAQADLQTVSRAKLTEPSAYLLKPFDERSLRIAIDLAMHKFTGQRTEQQAAVPEPRSLTADVLLRSGNHLFIKHQGKFVKIELDDLLYCQADGIYTDLISVRKKHTLRLPLTKVIEKLAETGMVRIHRSYAANIHKIDSIAEREITVNGQPIPVGNAYKEDFLQRFDLL